MDNNSIINKMKEYKDNRIIHLYEYNENLYIHVYENISTFVLYGCKSIKYNNTLNCYTAKTIKHCNDIKIGSTKEFNKKARIYGKRYGVTCYRAIYAEIYLSKYFDGKHNRRNAKHGQGDIIVNGEPIEIKFGNEITI